MPAERLSNSALHRKPGVEEAPLQSEVMLFDPVSAKFFVLNPTMAFLWRGCDGTKSLTEIAVAMTEEFDGVDQPTAERDLSIAATELSELGLLLPGTNMP